MESKQPLPPPNRAGDDDLDLGQLFNKTGSAVGTIFQRVGSFFSRAGRGIVLFLLFLRRNILWLLIGLVLGLGYGIYLTVKQGSKYHSSMTVRANFNSSRALYSTMDALNALISNRQNDTLAKLLNIQPGEAAQLVYFEATPVKSEIIAAGIYKDRFLTRERSEKLRIDTFWMNTLKYKDFKSSLTKFDYPVQEVSVTSTLNTVFPRIQQGIIDYISSNELLQTIKKSSAEVSQTETEVLTSSIRALDTLRNAYYQRIAGGNKDGGGNNITLYEGVPQKTSPELQLYDKLLELKDELKASRSQAALENDIIEVYSPFSPVGQKVSFFRQNIARYSLIGLGLAILIVSVIGLYRYSGELEKKYAALKRKPQ